MTAFAPALIAIDWGSSSLRAYLVARDGAALDELGPADGVAFSTETPRAAGAVAPVKRYLAAFAALGDQAAAAPSRAAPRGRFVLPRQAGHLA